MVAISTTGHPPETPTTLPVSNDIGWSEPNVVFFGLAGFLIVLALISVSTLIRELFQDSKARRRCAELVDVERRASIHQMTEQVLHAHRLAARLEALQAKSRTNAAVSVASRRIIELDDEVDRDVYALCSKLRCGSYSSDQISEELGAHRASVHDQLGDILRELDGLRGSKVDNTED